jgi:hypothetical protein
MQGNAKERKGGGNFADVRPIWVFMRSILVISSFVLDNPAKPLHPVLVDRNEFILRHVIKNLTDRWVVKVSHLWTGTNQMLWTFPKRTRIRPGEQSSGSVVSQLISTLAGVDVTL